MELIVKLFGVAVLTLVSPVVALVVVFLGISDAFQDCCAIASGSAERGSKLTDFIDVTIKALGLA